MSDNIIKSINLKIGKQNIDLTVEQAQELKEALNELFGQKYIQEKVIHHHDYWHWQWPYGTPTYRSEVYSDQTLKFGDTIAVAYNKGTVTIQDNTLTSGE